MADEKDPTELVRVKTKAGATTTVSRAHVDNSAGELTILTDEEATGTSGVLGPVYPETKKAAKS